ncbi:abortive infection family protein [Mycobacterium sp.]|uniref:abortive infection family protein n=1 Tax=Mycobacterium sp. TaxID=1785 RepID=UPI003D6BCDC2
MAATASGASSARSQPSPTDSPSCATDGLGTGHGPATARVGLGTRHAHLAVNAALTWCQLMLDTLADPEAPWRKGQLTNGGQTKNTKTTSFVPSLS